MENRVVVMEMGAITPTGNDVESFWNGLREKKAGIGPITYFDTTDYKTRLAVEVGDSDAKNYTDPKVVKRIEVFSQFTVAASKEAPEDSGLGMGRENPFHVGVNVGSSIGSLQSAKRKHKKPLEKGPNRMDPLLAPMMIDDMAAGNIAIQFGLKGKCINVVTACATGTHSIGEAFRFIQYGEAEVVLADGTEASICPAGVAGFTALTALDTTEDSMRASIPSDRERSGFVIGEGAGAVVLKFLEHAKAWGTHIYAEVVGHGATCDAYHIVSPAEDGSGAAMAIIYVIQDVGMASEDIDYINAHGTSTHHNDLSETKVIKIALDNHAYDAHINSTKSMIGHLLGTAGGVEFITRVEFIEKGYVHAIADLEIDDEECDSNYAKGEGVSTPVRYAISNSLGLGGHSVSVLVKRFEE